MQRLTAFLHPGDKIGAAGYQLVRGQARARHGRPLRRRPRARACTKLSYLPEAHTDMIVPIVGEELGLVGVLGLLVAFALLAWCGYSVALRAKDPFGKLLAAGLTTLIVGQAVLNIGGTLGVLPFTGVPVPLISLRRHEPDRDARGDRPRALRRHARRPGAARRRAGAQAGAQAGRAPPHRRATTGGSAPGRGRRGARTAPPGDVTTRRVLVAAGGTAGHVMPALAVAEELVRAGAEVTFAGTPGARRGRARARPPATRSMPSACRACRAGPRCALARALALDAAAPVACARILRRRRPHAVLGGGGFVAGPDAARRARARHPARADRGRRAPRARQPPRRAARRSRLPRLSAARARAAALRGGGAPGAARLLRDDARRGARASSACPRMRSCWPSSARWRARAASTTPCVAAYGATGSRTASSCTSPATRDHEQRGERRDGAARALPDARDDRSLLDGAGRRRPRRQPRGRHGLGARGGRPARAARTLSPCHGRPSARECEHFAAAGGAVIVEDAALDGELLRDARRRRCAREPGRLAAMRAGMRGVRAARCRGRGRARAPAAGAGARVSGELHLLGIGGAGMSGIARVLRGHGRTVSGCDRSPAAVEELRAEGIDARVGHDPAHLRPGMELIVSTRGRRATSPSSSRRGGCGLRVRHRSDVLAEIVAVGRRHLRRRRARQDEHERADRLRARRSAARIRRSWSAARVPQLGVNARVGAGPLRRGRGRRVGRLARAPAAARRGRPQRRARPPRPLRARSTTCTRSSRGWVARAARARACSCCTSRSATASRGRAAPLRRGAGGGLARARRREPTARARASCSRRPAASRCRCGSACPGAHNALNATAALALLDWAGIRPERAAAPLAAFRGAARRYERRGEVARHPPRRRLRAPPERARGDARRGARRGRARAPAGLLPAAHAVAHAHVRATASPRRCGWPTPPACATSTSRAAPPIRRSTGELVVDERAAPGPAFPIAWTPELRRRGRLDRRRPRAPGDLVLTLGAGPVDGVLGARARAAGMSAPPPAVEAGCRARAPDDDRHGRAGALLRAARRSAAELARGAAPGPRPSGSTSPWSASARTCWSPTRATTASPCTSRARSRRSRSTARACAAAAARRSRRSCAAPPTPALAGIEFGCAIPGTVGGAVRMNAGAYGSEIRDVLARPRSSRRRRRGSGGPAELELTLPPLERAPGEVVAEARAASSSRGERERDPRARARDAAAPQREPAAQGAHVRVGLQEPGRGPGRGRADRGLRAQGPRHRRRAHLDGARELHREHRRRALGRRRGAGRRWPGAACASASASISSTRCELLGPVSLA